MSAAGPDFQSHGPVQADNVLQGVTTGDNTTINFLDGGKGGAPVDEREGSCTLARPAVCLQISDTSQPASAASASSRSTRASKT